MFLILLITVCTLAVAYIKWNFTYWQRKNFPCAEFKIPFGVLESVRQRERGIGTAIEDVYNASKDQVIGIYLMLRPALLVRDAHLVRSMMTKDFSSFHDRGVYEDAERDPMSGNLFAIRGKKWKNLRTSLTPSFSTGKLKGMFVTVEDVADKMIKHVNSLVPEHGTKELELKKLFSTYAIDIIASVIFGLEVDSFVNPDNDLHRVSQRINRPTLTDLVRGTCQFLYPNLEKIFVALGWHEEAPEAMKEITRRTVEMREKNNISRKDMLQMLMQLRNSGAVSADDNDWTAKNSDVKHMTIESIAAQLFLFYVAGYETTASTAAFTIYELSQYPELLERAQNDISAALETHGKICYEAVQDMKFLDMCIMETVRKYPGLPILNRECTQDYAIPDTNLVIKKGTPIIISLLGMHRDEKYFPEPMLYDPDRFSNGNYEPAAYMPFGEGPRHCIAQRMGKINAKVAIAKFLTNYNIEINPRREIEIANFGIPIVAKDGITVRISKRHNAAVV